MTFNWSGLSGTTIYHSEEISSYPCWPPVRENRVSHAIHGPATAKASRSKLLSAIQLGKVLAPSGSPVEFSPHNVKLVTERNSNYLVKSNLRLLLFSSKHLSQFVKAVSLDCTH